MLRSAWWRAGNMSAPAMVSPSIKLMAFGSYEFVEGAEFYFVALAALVLVYAGSRVLVRSQFGLVLAGMRQNEERLAFFGYRVQMFKAIVFSAGRHGRRPVRRALQLSSGLHGSRQFGAGPVHHGRDLLPLRRQRNAYRPVFGHGVRSSFSATCLPISDAIRQFWPVILGLVLLVVVMFQPTGLLGLIVSARERIGSFGVRREARLMALLDIAAVTKVYGPLRALDGVDLQVEAGTFHGLIGPNGSGKSTLLKSIAGAHFPTAGNYPLRWAGHHARCHRTYARDTALV